MEISYIGMKKEEVGIKSHLKITMKTDSEILQEVVVTGMQRMDKRLFTGAATKLSADNVKMDGMAEISRALEGRAAGVSVQNVSVLLVQHLKFACVVLLLSMVVRSHYGW